MNFATWSIRNPIPAILLFALLGLAGLWGFLKLPIQNLPDLDLPTIDVTLTQPGAAPAQLETEIARKVEDSLANLSGLRHLRTSITDGQVSIAVEFVLEKNLSDALIESKDAVDRVRSELPTDMQEPTVSAVTTGGDATLVYAISSSRMDEEALSWFVDDTVAKTVLAVPGTGKFERVGGVQREVRVEVDPVRLAALSVTAADVSHALLQAQQQSSGAAGSSAAPSSPCAPSPRRSRPQTWRRCPSPCPRDGSCDWTRSPRSVTRPPNAPRRRCSMAGRLWASRSIGPRALMKSAWPRP